MTRPEFLSAAVRALAFDVRVESEDEGLVAAFEDAFAACRRDDLTDVRRLRVVAPTPADPRGRLLLDGEEVATFDDTGLALAWTVWQVNREAIASARGPLLHAGGAARDGAALLLPGAPGSGKSTLVARLVADGFDYLSDEAVMLADGGTLVPYPKPVTLEPPSWPLFAPPFESGDARARHHVPDWQLAPHRLRAGAEVARGATARLVVAAVHDPDADGTPEPLTRAEALMLLGDQSFNLEALGAPAFHALAATVRACRCVRLRHPDARVAARVVADLLASAGSDGEFRRIPSEFAIKTGGGAPMPRVRDDVVVEELDGEAVVFDALHTRLHHLSATALAVWQHCDGASDRVAVEAHLASAFAAPLADVQRDVDRLLAELDASGLLAPPTPAA